MEDEKVAKMSKKKSPATTVLWRTTARFQLVNFISSTRKLLLLQQCSSKGLMCADLSHLCYHFSVLFCVYFFLLFPRYTGLWHSWYLISGFTFLLSLDRWMGCVTGQFANFVLEVYLVMLCYVYVMYVMYIGFCPNWSKTKFNVGYLCCQLKNNNTLFC